MYKNPGCAILSISNFCAAWLIPYIAGFSKWKKYNWYSDNYEYDTSHQMKNVTDGSTHKLVNNQYTNAYQIINGDWTVPIHQDGVWQRNPRLNVCGI